MISINLDDNLDLNVKICAFCVSLYSRGPVFQRSGVFSDGLSDVHDLGQELVDSLMWT